MMEVIRKVKKMLKIILSKVKLIVKIAIVCIIAAAGFYYYTVSTIPKAETVTAAIGTISKTIDGTGYTRASECYDVEAPLAGKLLSVNAKEGQKVSAGQTIAVIQNLDLSDQINVINQQILTAQANLKSQNNALNTSKVDLDQTSKTVKTNEELLQSGAISQTEYDNSAVEEKKLSDSVASMEAQIKDAQDSLNQLINQRESINRKIGQLTVACPINSTILTVPSKAGQMVAGGTSIVTVGTPGRLEVTIDLLCDDIPSIKQGQLTDITFAGEKIYGRVKQIYPQAFEKVSELGVSQRMVTVVISLDRNGDLKPNYEVQVSIHTSTKKNIVTVPREAVMSDENGNSSVMLIASGLHKNKYVPMQLQKLINKIIPAETVRLQKVSLGIKDDVKAEVKSGLKAGDEIIKDGSSDLPDNSKVLINENADK